MEPKSLLLLHVSIEGLNRKMRDGLAKMDEIVTECRIIDQYKTEIEANKNFVTKVKVLKSSKIDLDPGTYVTNCSHCNRTCHYPCYIPNDCDKIRCFAMDSNGICRFCGCNWNMHFNMQFRWEVYVVEEERTLNELKEKYGDAKSKKQTREKMLENVQNEYKKLWELTSKLMNKCKKCLGRLNEIALKPITLSEIEYIEL